MSKPLIIKYQGKRKEIDLLIEDCPDDLEIRTQLEDPDYEADWKTLYLKSYYEEHLNDQRESKEERHTSLESFTYEDARYFSSTCNPQEKLEDKEIISSLMSACNENQKEALRLHYLEGYSKTEIAEIKGVDESAIRRTINRALEKIKRNL